MPNSKVPVRQFHLCYLTEMRADYNEKIWLEGKQFNLDVVSALLIVPSVGWSYLARTEIGTSNVNQ